MVPAHAVHASSLKNQFLLWIQVGKSWFSGPGSRVLRSRAARIYLVTPTDKPGPCCATIMCKTLWLSLPGLPG